MELKVKELKVGSRLCFGRYTSERTSPGGVYISWLKTDDDCGYISEYVIDHLVFDARENGAHVFNSDYYMSNIYQFANSDKPAGLWWQKMHEDDTPPDSAHLGVYDAAYSNHDGFLRWFDSYERATLVSDIHLPDMNDIIGPNRLKLFKKRAIRARRNPADLTRRNYRHTTSDTFDSYWTRNSAGPSVYTIGADGRPFLCFAASVDGFRPFCRIDPEAMVHVHPNGEYRLSPYDVSDRTLDEVLDDTTPGDFLDFLGYQ